MCYTLSVPWGCLTSAAHPDSLIGHHSMAIIPGHTHHTHYTLVSWRTPFDRWSTHPWQPCACPHRQLTAVNAVCTHLSVRDSSGRPINFCPARRHGARPLPPPYPALPPPIAPCSWPCAACRRLRVRKSPEAVWVVEGRRRCSEAWQC